MASIFVGIPSYADPDLPFTVDSAARHASGEHRIVVGVCEQASEYMRAWRLGGPSLPAHTQVHVVFHGVDTLLGLGGARAETAALYDGEDHMVMVDAHTRFETHWDRAVVEMLGALPPKSIVTGLMPMDPWSGAGDTPVNDIEGVNEDGLPISQPNMVPGLHVYDCRHVQDGSLFGTPWIGDVPYDRNIVFYGQEQVLTPRLWCAGYDLYHAPIPFRHGCRVPPFRPWEREGWAAWNEASRRRCRLLLGIDEDVPEDDPARVDLEQYSCGGERSFEEWRAYSGFDYARGAVATRWGDWPPTLNQNGAG